MKVEWSGREQTSVKTSPKNKGESTMVGKCERPLGLMGYNSERAQQQRIRFPATRSSAVSTMRTIGDGGVLLVPLSLGSREAELRLVDATPISTREGRLEAHTSRFALWRRG